MKAYKLIIFSLTLLISCFCNGQNSSTNVNQNTVVVNNQPVIEKVKYIEKYRPVYIDKPQPKRVARKLSAPVCLLKTIWVYVEDLGNFLSQEDALEIIEHLNNIGACGRNDWRIPTSAELTIMEKYADQIGLGYGIYLATSHKNGILRPVSTGLSIKEQQAAQKAEKQKVAATQKAERQRVEAEQKRKEEQQRHEQNVLKARKQAQQEIINNGQGISDGYRIWASANVGALSTNDKGDVFSSYSPQGGWRLPSSAELKSFVSDAAFSQRPYNGVMRKIYTYKNIVLFGGRYLTSDGYYDVGTNDGLSGNKGYVRLVQSDER